MKKPLQTKCSKLIDRERLFRQWEQENRHVFLSAQSGYGKTKAVEGYCKSRAIEACWHDCTGMEPPDFLEEILESGSFDREKFLVFDHFERMKEHRILQQMAGKLLSLECQVFFLSRHQPPKEFARLFAEDRITLFSKEELCMTETEVEEEAFRVTKGYPAALYFYQQIKKDGEPVAQKKLFMMTFLLDYIENEFFMQADAGERLFLVRASVVDGLTKELCEQALSLPEVKKNLSRLTKKNFLSVTWEKGQEVWKIDDLLLLYLREKFEPELSNTLLQKIGILLLQQNEYQQLPSLAERNKNLAGFLLEYAGRHLMESGEMDVFGKIYHCSEKQTLSIPALEIAAEYHYRMGQYQELFACLNQADSHFGSENKYSAYRSLYRGLLYFAQEPEQYEKQINHVCFYLNEKKEPFPYLTEKHQKLLRYVQLEKDTVAKSSQKPLQVKVFGGFSLKVTEDGQEISWRTKKGSELFAYLFSQKQPVERRQILSALWEEEIPNSAVSMLHNMIYNFRKELSAYKLEQVIFSQNKKYSLDFELLSSDHDKISQVVPLVEEKDVEKLYDYRGLFENYWGSYMEDFDSFWAQEQRVFYDKIYEEGAMLLSEYCMKKGSYKEAKLLLKGVLNQNPYSEPAMVKLLWCLRELREFISIKNEYKIFVERLFRELDLRPGKELEQVFEQLVQRK